MREIKFRGFSIAKKKWVYGNYNYTFERGYISQGYDDVPPRCYYIDTETNYYEVYPQTVGQYTGLKDKNGKEIFEGDIVKYFDNKEHIVVVENIKELGTGMYLKRVGSGYYTLNPSVIRDYEVEVIGDIYENPELLEVV